MTLRILLAETEITKGDKPCRECSLPYGDCLCLRECRCGWLYDRRGECSNPLCPDRINNNREENDS